jgi:sugar phosphate isomerase/epimerase
MQINPSRRIFIKNSAIALAGTAVLPGYILAQQKKIQRLGIQLYTVRDAMKADPRGTLTRLNKVGVSHVEHANYIDRKFYGYTAKEFKKVLSDVELLMPSGHVVMTAQDWDAPKRSFTDKWKYTVDDAAEVGQRYLISPWLDEALRTDLDALKRFMEQFNKCGELCASHGMKFGYHNHNFEFNTMVGGIKLYDYILQNTEQSLVAQQMDIGNMYGAGGIALDYINKYPGRFELMHVKDEIKSVGKGDLGDGYESTILGKGLLPLKAILKAAGKTGKTSVFIIEQEAYQGLNPVDCLKMDLEVMKKLGY